MMAAQEAKKRAEPRDHLVTGVSRAHRRKMRDSDGDGEGREGGGKGEEGNIGI
jgi:hypothetical protein